MRKRKLGSSDLYVSELSVGCMSLGLDEDHARKIIEAALDEGINYFDTADLYDYGKNEKMVGKALKHVRDDVIIATKVGNRWEQNKDGWVWDPSKHYIKEAVKKSIQRLDVDYIDLYQLHGGTIEDPIDETIEAFEELKSEGFIRYYGISSIRPNVIRKYVQSSNIVSVMMQYSLLDRRPEEVVMPLLSDNNISIVTRGSIAKGLLTDNWREKLTDSVRENGYLQYSYNELTELLVSLENRFQHEHSLTRLAIQFNLAHKSVASVVAGASSVQQLKDNVQAVQQKPLSKEELSLLQSLTKEAQYTVHR
ncbi:aryl-alcohol dehydrogenase-like predicted oxidoreductase [Oikeobacillus pervagus]|uniref:Aryl-alcohol dehydrogenase-like predicted oxidoreductase n=1 Tax=Oikeobacillus pervagus TaxID=1325931 RepID=A0AAJ1WHX0_9BACI|nr:aldo/keto reductase [Oikeobacillus pervagus]MDQ0213768.1 aryl-alcohol dehydrogenase-like predicted oxidoreductase [Oikeobacillus pervagus]